MHIVVRSSVPSAGIVPDVRRAVQTVDRTLAVHDERLMMDVVRDSLQLERVTSLVMTFFGFAALLMATLGIYGVVSYGVRQRTVELGTRMALGAVGRDLMKMVVGGGLHWVVEADIVVASEEATFRDTHVNVGFVGNRENLGLVLKAGLGAALYLSLVGTSAVLDARRGQELGLVQEVVPTGNALRRALELADTISRNSPSAMANELRTLWTMARLHYDEAVQWAERLVELQPGDPKQRFELGVVLQRAGRLAESVAAYSEAVRLKPDYAGAHLNRGLTLLALGEFQRGWAGFEWRWAARRAASFSSSSARASRWYPAG